MVKIKSFVWVRRKAWPRFSFPLHPPPTKKTHSLTIIFTVRERRQLLVSDPKPIVILMFQFSRSVREAIICPVLITKLWFIYLGENFVGFYYPFACGSPSLLCLEKHWCFHFRPPISSLMIWLLPQTSSELWIMFGYQMLNRLLHLFLYAAFIITV